MEIGELEYENLLAGDHPIVTATVELDTPLVAMEKHTALSQAVSGDDIKYKELDFGADPAAILAKDVSDTDTHALVYLSGCFKFSKIKTTKQTGPANGYRFKFQQAGLFLIGEQPTWLAVP